MEGINHSHIDRVIVSKGKTNQTEDAVNYLDKKGKEKKEGELDKSPRDIEIINFAQEKLNEYLLEYNRERVFDIPLDKIHIMPVDGIEGLFNGSQREGVASGLYGTCLVDRNPNDVTYSIRLFHELLHLKVHTAISINKNNINIHRSGFSVFDTKNDKIYFKLMNEIITDYFCKRFFEEKIKKSDLYNKQEVDSYVFDSPRNNLLETFESEIEKLYNRNKNDFDNKEDVRSLFINATLNGKLLPVARLLEKTYGPGTFRRFGENTK